MGIPCKPATRTLTAFLALSFGSAYGAERLRIGVSNYNLSSLSMGVAHSRGFFKEEGFDSEVIRMNPNVATTAAVTGDIDFSALIGSLIGAAIKSAPPAWLPVPKIGPRLFLLPG